MLLVCGLCALVGAHPFDARLVEYNLNINESALAGDILSYSGAWPDKVANGYTSSPDNWRALPTYTVMHPTSKLRAGAHAPLKVLLDKAADGDPSNNDFFSTPYEWDLSSNRQSCLGPVGASAPDDPCRTTTWRRHQGFCHATRPRLHSVRLELPTASKAVLALTCRVQGDGIPLHLLWRHHVRSANLSPRQASD